MRTAIDGQATAHEQAAFRHPLVTRYEAGATLSGKYQLEALLGEGGMGAVWRARNVLLDLPVAIKLVRADLNRDEFRARLQLEARAAAKLGHSSIVRVFDVGESELGDPFIVMEHLRGETLAHLISRGRVPATRAVQLLLPIIDALAAAHARGIVHRDLKPDNVMIAVEEQRVCPKILDFGIAKLTDPRDADLKLTEVGAVVGSPEYMSPEQARGRDDIDASTDTWSTCVVLYETVTGCPPFSASNCNALLRSIVEDAPKPLAEHALQESELWQILERGLRKDREQRYAKISELGYALASWLSSRGVTEDACGSSLESKWLGRRGDRLRSAPPSDHLSFQPPQATDRDSVPDSTGIARGPFTKTILPGTHGRTRTLSAAVAVGALFAVSWFSFGRSSHAERAHAGTATTAAHAQATLASAGPSVTEAPTPIVATPVESAAEPTPVPEVRLSGSTQREVKPASTAARAARINPVRAVPPVTHTVSAANQTPAAAKPERPLDLLAPY